MRNIKKIDQIQIDLHTYICNVKDQCKINFAWNLFGTDTTIIISFAGIFFAYKFAWFDTPAKIIAYMVVNLMIIVVITLFRWNRTLINSLSEVTKLSEGLIGETSELQGKHSALARDHEKNTDHYESLREHYAVLVKTVSLIEKQSIQDAQRQISRKQGRR